MFFTLDQIKQSLGDIAGIHPFFGTTFLVCKKDKLPVGTTINYAIASSEETYLNLYFRPDKTSRKFYATFRTPKKENRWRSPKYASSGLQSVRTRGPFANVFIHDTNTDVWGWQRDYVARLVKNLSRGKRVPIFPIAVWLFREFDWPSSTTSDQVVQKLIEDFHLTEEELNKVFDASVANTLEIKKTFQATKVEWEELQQIIGSPTGSPPSESGILSYLELQGIGPAKSLILSLSKRLNVITGDNGLGKTFLLECAWWALTNQWAGPPAYPREDAKRSEPQITFKISGQTQTQKAKYDWQLQTWPSQQKRPTVPGLLIYARVDGSFAVWDPAKHYWTSQRQNSDSQYIPVVFTKDQVWDGWEQKSEGKSQVFLNGLLRDWITWQNKPDKYPFDTFKSVLLSLSPDDIGPLVPGEPRRVPFDAREIPTIRHPYGEVPILHAAAGIRRIVSMAYLLVWTWNEHQAQSALLRREPDKQMVVLVDEIEAHLHPKWQRMILPALLKVGEILSDSLQIQFVIATHSPLVLASAEPQFDEELDNLFHLQLDGDKVSLDEIPFVRQGDVNAWLTSDIFDLASTRNIEAEQAVQEATKLQLEDQPSSDRVKEVSDQLRKLLSSDDPFWPRWTYFAEQHGVEL